MRDEDRRRGAAIVELALFLPVYFLVTMGTVETCRALYLRQSLKIAAYECARLGIIPGTTFDDLEAQCDAVLEGRRIKSYRLSIDPPNLNSLHYGEVLTATITLSTRDNSLAAPWFYRAATLVESVKIMGEHDETN